MRCTLTLSPARTQCACAGARARARALQPGSPSAQPARAPSPALTRWRRAPAPELRQPGQRQAHSLPCGDRLWQTACVLSESAVEADSATLPLPASEVPHVMAGSERGCGERQVRLWDTLFADAGGRTDCLLRVCTAMLLNVREELLQARAPQCPNRVRHAVQGPAWRKNMEA